MEAAYLDALAQFKAQHPDWRNSALERAYVQDLNHVIYELHLAVEQLGFSLTNNELLQGPFADSMLFEIKWEFGVTNKNLFRPEWIPHTDDQIRQMQAQTEGYFSGNLLTIQHILEEELYAVLVPHFYDFESSVFHAPPRLYHYAHTKLTEIMGMSGITRISPIQWLWEYLLGLSQQQQTSP